MRTEGFKCIGRNRDGYVFVQSVFEYGNELRGVTGCIVRPVTEGEYNWASEPENIQERLGDLYDVQYNGAFYDSDIEHEARERDLARFCADVVSQDGIESIMWDPSYTCEASAEFERLNIEHEATDCVGCGRIFNKDTILDECFNPQAVKAIRDYEGGHITYELACQRIFGN